MLILWVLLYLWFFDEYSDIFLYFFFSSRIRHTRWNCDWSSDVCSSDLASRPLRTAAMEGSEARQKRGIRDMADSRLHQLSARGQSVWIDYLSRDMLQQGELARMMEEDAVVGVTSNPTIFQKAISQGTAYDEQLQELLGHETDPKEIFLQLAVRDVEGALDLLEAVHNRQPEDGYVSLEVDPTLAYDAEATYDEAIRFHSWIDRPNLY